MRAISLWSGPRNVSTALMYSFAQREDCEVIDEPLYAHYLSKVDVHHPGEEEVLATMNHDGREIIDQLLIPGDRPLRFIKKMAHHWINLDDGLLKKFSNIFLIRDPKEMLPSLINQIPNPVLRDTALKSQWDLYSKLANSGAEVAIIDSAQLLMNPKAILGKVCKTLKIPFDDKMLTWAKGSIPEDGVWAKYWYHNVHKSTGFQPYRKKDDLFPDHLSILLDECEPYYKLLFNHSIK